MKFNIILFLIVSIVYGENNPDSLKTPVLISQITPAYSDLMIKNNVEGIIKANLLINTNGMVDKCVLLNNLGYDSEKQVLEAAQKMRFKPAEKMGQPIKVWVTYRFKFQLTENREAWKQKVLSGLGILLFLAVFFLINIQLP